MAKVGDKIRITGLGLKHENYRIIRLESRPDGQWAFITPIRKNGEDCTFGQIARYCQWTKVSTLGCVPEPNNI